MWNPPESTGRGLGKCREGEQPTSTASKGGQVRSCPSAGAPRSTGRQRPRRVLAIVVRHGSEIKLPATR